MKPSINVHRGYVSVARNLMTGFVMAGLLLISLSAAHAQVGKIVSWGSNQYGQKSGSNSAPATIVQMSAGANHTLAVDSAGGVWAWGDNRVGQLGDGTLVPRGSAAQVAGFPKTASQVAAGQDFSLALLIDGTVWAFGNNNVGQLGDNTTTLRKAPVQVSGLTNVVQIAAGGSHGLALISDGTVRSWGGNLAGQLGDGTTSDRHVPVKVKNLTNVIQVAASYFHSLAAGFDGTAWAWGYNTYGQLGDGTNTSRSAPVQMKGLTNVQQVAAGSYHSIVLGFDGSVWTTGYNIWGQLGDGHSGSSANQKLAENVIPAPAAGTPTNVQVVAGNGHNIVVKSDGTLWSWGNNEFGQLGDGTGTNRSLPVQVLLAGPTYVTAGWFHSAAVKAVITNIKVVLAASKFQYATPSIFIGGALKTDPIGVSVLQLPLAFNLVGADLGTFLTPASSKVFVNLNTADYNVGSYNYTISCVGNRLYNSTVRKGALVIIKAVCPLRWNGASSAKVGQTVTLAAILKRSSDGALLVNQPLHLMLDGVSLGDFVTDGTGRAAMTYKVDEPLAIGAHTLTTNFDGDSNHASSTLSTTFTVNPSAVSLGVTKITASFGQTVNLQAQLTRKTDNKRLVNQPITFSIDGTMIGSVNTDANGIAKLPYLVEVPFALGAHTIQADFAGTDNYTALSNTAVLTVNQAKTALAQVNQIGKVGAAITLKATLTRTTDKMGLANQTVTFTVNGVVVGTGVTDASGVATLPTTVPSLTAGKYNLTVSFDGDANYVAISNVKGVLTVR